MITMRAVAAAAVVALMSAAPAIADPDAVDGPVPPSNAVTPGAGVGLYDANSRGASACTLGFLATDSDGRRYVFTAGHCDKGGSVVMPYLTPTGFRRVGLFAHTVDEPAADIAAIALADTAPPYDARVLSRRPVTAVTDAITDADTLCFYGMRTGGRPHCGRVISPAAAADDNYLVVFGAVSVHGDSGSPVYRIESDGNATAVAILNSGTATSSTATLIEPFLSRWNLSLTCQTAPNTTETCHA